MPKINTIRSKERLKIEIAFLEKQFFGATAGVAALTGWAAAHLKESTPILLAALILILALVLVCAYTRAQLYRLRRHWIMLNNILFSLIIVEVVAFLVWLIWNTARNQ